MTRRRLPPSDRHDPPGRFHGPHVLSYTVASWCASDDAPATAVALALKVEWRGDMPPIDLVLRLKTPAAVDTLIQCLLRHKRHVWPEAP
jgi:hypothetical protein